MFSQSSRILKHIGMITIGSHLSFQLGKLKELVIRLVKTRY